MIRVIGIDGGGSSTQAGLLEVKKDMNLESIGPENYKAFETGATNYHNVGLDVAKERFQSILDHYALGDYKSIDAICLGGAGIDCDLDQKNIEALFRSIGYQGHLQVVNDSVTALVGGNRGAGGGIVIAGTGSITYGIVGPRMIRVGGWGNVLDDEGSGYDLGRRAIKHVMESYDGRATGSSLLWQHIQAALKLESQEDLIGYVYGPEASKGDVAAIAPIVLALYGKDEVSTNIVHSGIEGLGRMARALSVQLEQRAFPLTVGGSLLTKSELYLQLFKKEIKFHLPEVTVHRPMEGPVEGALRMAIKQLEVCRS